MIVLPYVLHPILMAQFSLNNVHKRSLKHNHFILPNLKEFHYHKLNAQYTTQPYWLRWLRVLLYVYTGTNISGQDIYIIIDIHKWLFHISETIMSVTQTISCWHNDN